MKKSLTQCWGRYAWFKDDSEFEIENHVIHVTNPTLRNRIVTSENIRVSKVIYQTSFFSFVLRAIIQTWMCFSLLFKSFYMTLVGCWKKNIEWGISGYFSSPVEIVMDLGSRYTRYDSCILYEYFITTVIHLSVALWFNNVAWGFIWFNTFVDKWAEIYRKGRGGGNRVIITK